MTYPSSVNQRLRSVSVHSIVPIAHEIECLSGKPVGRVDCDQQRHQGPGGDGNVIHLEIDMSIDVTRRIPAQYLVNSFEPVRFRPVPRIRMRLFAGKTVIAFATIPLGFQD